MQNEETKSVDGVPNTTEEISTKELPKEEIKQEDIPVKSEEAPKDTIDANAVKTDEEFRQFLRNN